MAVRRNKIEQIVERLLQENRVTDAPVPIHSVAKRCGARIFVDSLEGDLSGFFYRDKNSAVIGVNTHHSKPRQNFTIAHELGHYLLHEQEQLHIDHEFRVRLRNDESSKGVQDAEREANLFAACLLMPRKFLDKDLEGTEFIDVFDDDVISDLAKKYEVSTQALVYRLKNLGYIQE